ncbi:MAG: hypothetical protein GXP45_07205 [bacterium]|nr:hypothetical protein [bacterium]
MTSAEANNMDEYSDALRHTLRWTIRQAFNALVSVYEDSSLTRRRAVFMTLKSVVQNKM